jgi:addiction module HigA family antidote
MKKLPPMHPEEVLREEYMAPLRLTAYALAQHIGVPRPRLERIVREQQGITADTALRLEPLHVRVWRVRLTWGWFGGSDDRSRWCFAPPTVAPRCSIARIFGTARRCR